MFKKMGENSGKGKEENDKIIIEKLIGDGKMGLKELLQERYQSMEVIFLEDIGEENKEEMEALVNEGFLDKYQEGVYVIPPEMKILKIKKRPIIDKYSAVRQKYVKNKKGERIGFLIDLNLANIVGTSTQVPNVCMVATNNMTHENGKEFNFFGSRVILFELKEQITKENYGELKMQCLFEMEQEKELVKNKSNVIRYFSRYFGEEEAERKYEELLNKKQNKEIFYGNLYKRN